MSKLKAKSGDDRDVETQNTPEAVSNEEPQQALAIATNNPITHSPNTAAPSTSRTPTLPIHTPITNPPLPPPRHRTTPMLVENTAGGTTARPSAVPRSYHPTAPNPLYHPAPAANSSTYLQNSQYSASQTRYNAYLYYAYAAQQLQSQIWPGQAYGAVTPFAYYPQPSTQPARTPLPNAPPPALLPSLPIGAPVASSSPVAAGTLEEGRTRDSTREGTGIHARSGTSQALAHSPPTPHAGRTKRRR